MASFVVLTPPDDVGKDDATVLIRDGFAWLALVFPVIWLLWHRLWFAALLLLLLSVAIAAAIAAFPDQSLAFTAASLVISVFVALEGNGWRVGKKERQGWTFQTVIEAPDHATAEEIWFSRAAADQAPKSVAMPSATKKPKMMHPAPVGSGPALGLLDYRDRG